MKAEKEREIQKKYIQAQLLKQQINAMIEQKNAIDERITELKITEDALNKLVDVKKGEEIWSSIGSGAFVRSDIKDNDNVLIGVGAGIVLKKDRGRASAILEERVNEMKKVDLEIMEEVTNYARQIEQLESEIQSLAEQMEKKKKGK